MTKSAPDDDVSLLLAAASAGERKAFDRVFQLVYEELRRLARQVRRGRGSETLNTTALVHEAYLRLLPSRGLAWEGRSHFMAVAARAMRQVLVRAAEQHATAKRGGGQAHLPLDESAQPALGGDAGMVDPVRLLALDSAVALLETFSPRQARVIECRFFAGLSVEETARALDISEPTVKRDWSANDEGAQAAGRRRVNSGRFALEAAGSISRAWQPSRRSPPRRSRAASP